MAASKDGTTADGSAGVAAVSPLDADDDDDDGAAAVGVSVLVVPFGAGTPSKYSWPS